MSPLTLYTADGQVIVAEDGPPWQHTDEGFNTYLSTNSVPLDQWGAGVSFGKLYETQPWLAIVINKLTRQISRLPLKAYERNSQGERARLTEGPLIDSISSPEPRKGPIDFKQWASFPTMLHGNSLIGKRRRSVGAPPSGYEYFDWRQVTPPTKEKPFWTVGFGRDRRILELDEVVHFAWLSTKLGGLGISPLQQLGVTIRIESAAQRYQEWNFKNSVRPSGGVKMPEGVVLDKELRAEMRADLNRVYAGPENAGRPILLPAGIEWQPMAQTTVEAELIEQRKLNREECAALYDLQPPMIGILEKATFNNVTELHKMLYTDTLGPWLVLVEEQFKAQAIDTEPTLKDQWVEFDLREVLRGDPVKEAAAMKTELQDGVLTINEGREILNRPRIKHPNADRPMVQTNNISFLGDEPLEQEDADALETNIAKAVNRLAAVSPTFAAALNDDPEE
ncbi:MAG TPA: phage portal protein [Solirubrobacterales bacterium]|nr:phage portal protein [Solirubrobacterales bacterium]